jgi:hypothetical protein
MMIEFEIATLAERLLDAAGTAPTSRERRVRWARGFVHGYLGLPYDIAMASSIRRISTPRFLLPIRIGRDSCRAVRKEHRATKVRRQAARSHAQDPGSGRAGRRGRK